MIAAWYLLIVQRIASAVSGLADGRHLMTDPACIHHRAPRPRSRLDRASRGVSCVPCMVHRAFYGDWEPDRKSAGSEVSREG